MIITFWSVDGGVGKTTLAVNTACKLAKQNPFKKVLLLDLNLNNPDTDKHLGFEPKNLVELYNDFYTNSITVEKIRNYLIKHHKLSNLFIFSGLYNIEYVCKFQPEHFELLIEYYRNMDFNYIVIDINSVLNYDASYVAVDKGDILLVVGEPTMASLRNLQRYLNTITQIKDKNDIFIVINKYRTDILSKDLIIKTFPDYKVFFIERIDAMEKYINNQLPVALIEKKNKQENTFDSSLNLLLKSIVN